MKNPRRHAEHTLLEVVLVFTALLFTSVQIPLYAQSDPSKTKLIELIHSVEKEIDTERSELKRIKQKSKNRTSAIQKERNSTANNLVSIKRTIQRLDKKQRDLQTSRKKLNNKIESMQETVDRARDLYPVLRSIIRRWTESTPHSLHKPDHKAALREANKLMKSKDQPVKAVNKCSQIVISLLQEGRQAQLLNTSIRTPDGKRRDVELIRAGRSFVAYRTTKNHQFGIRVDGETGFRWQTGLSDNQKERISRTIEQLKTEADSSQSFSSLVLPLDPTQEMTSEKSGRTLTFIERLYAGGPVMIPLGLIALVALGLILERLWTLRREQTDVNTLLQDVQTALKEDNFDAAIARCNDHPGAVSSVLQTLINARTESPETMQDRVEEAILQQMPRLERFLPSLNVLAGVAPLLGLLGTVTGIIETFDVIAVFGSGNQQLMAGGISEALMTTATGLVIAIPILLFHGYFRSRVDTIIGNMERTAATIYNFLQSEPIDGTDEPEQNFRSN